MSGIYILYHEGKIIGSCEGDRVDAEAGAFAACAVGPISLELVAAAPKLLMACEHAVDNCDHTASIQFDFLREAIADAKREQT